ncbi:hypothetical protein ACMBCN_02725 [Candidatus Liberibacter asiaticus]|nr:hypothetical protein [Candidatus Liberibacter asiaticus]
MRKEEDEDEDEDEEEEARIFKEEKMCLKCYKQAFYRQNKEIKEMIKIALQ